MMTEGEILKARAFCRYIKDSTGHDLEEHNPALPLLMIFDDVNKKHVERLSIENNEFLNATKGLVEEKIIETAGTLEEKFNAINAKLVDGLVKALAADRISYTAGLKKEIFSPLNQAVSGNTSVANAMAKKMESLSETVLSSTNTRKTDSIFRYLTYAVGIAFLVIFCTIGAVHYLIAQYAFPPDRTLAVFGGVFFLNVVLLLVILNKKS